MKNITYLIISLILGASLICAGYFIQNGLIAINSADRYVTVKGLAEDNVKSDLAIWAIPFKVADNSLDIAKTELQRQSQVIERFLQKNGINADEISINTMTINDAYANQYQDNRAATRYAIDKTILVRTHNVDAVNTASQKIGDLIAEGVLVGYGSLPQYSYTQLNDIKPRMIAEATKNARDAAQKFANDSGAKVGTIKSASQGYFSINARDNISGVPSSAALYKKIRIVSSVAYYLHD